MTIRVIVVFILALIGVAYLLGPSFGGADFYLAVVAAAGITLVIFLWLYRADQTADPFDPRATSRAVHRGVGRTAITAVTWVAVGFWLLSLFSQIWQTRGGRENHFRDLVQYGLLVANPGFAPAVERLFASCCDEGIRSLKLHLQLAPRTAGSVPQTFSVDVELDLRGRIEPIEGRDWPPSPVASVTNSLTGEPPPTKAQTNLILARLPNQVVATAVVEFRRPQAIASLYALFDRYEIDPARGQIPILFGWVWGRPDRARSFLDRPLSWPKASVAEFQLWAKGLRRSDDGNLRSLGLPSSRRIKEIAGSARVYGFILQQAPIALLERLLADSSISTMKVADAAFDLTPR